MRLRRQYLNDAQLERFQQATDDRVRELSVIVEQPFGDPKGPYYTDCKASIGDLVIVEPAEDMSVTLEKITKADIGQIITIKYNKDAEWSVTVRPADSNDTIDGEEVKVITSRMRLSLVALPNQQWGIML